MSLVSIAVALGWGGAKTTATSITLAAALASLVGSEWGLDGHDRAFIQFRDGAVSGHSGCNRFSGAYTFDGQQITIGPLAGTRMACPPDVMEKESAFLRLLEGARQADATPLTLVLKDEAGNALATLKRRDAD